MSFQVGQKVVCVDADGAPRLKLGARYAVSHVYPCSLWFWRDQWIETSPI